MSRGVVTSVNHDGLIIARPRRAAPRFPVKGIILMIIAFFAFKGFLLAQLGDATYGQRIATLQQGTGVEQAGAWAMQVDPLTQWIAGQIGTYLN
ncbi:hypothetical protein HRQ87_05385 [Sulfitobacter sp. 1151]|uniref:Uncharacterized protein n=1 Tax=Parasulfitobacter algicola TaxID=2614809 RepID=A0ABX2IMW0_9RHOB|nr:hypothetical protein [Sulfitobacter algicola]NSX54226.1 hypothetical protein [Sulfitobacter algicola]